jgi:hypothetical protein
MTPQERFVTRLRRERQRHQLSLEEISIAVRIRPELFEGLENNDLSQWPRGLYARAWVRAYAEAVGLDGNATVNEFCRLFSHGDRRAQGTMEDLASLVASPSEYRDEFSHPGRRSTDTAPEPAPRLSWHAPVSEAGRLLMVRLAGLKDSPYLRTRRDAGTTGS